MYFEYVQKYCGNQYKKYHFSHQKRTWHNPLTAWIDAYDRVFTGSHTHTRAYACPIGIRINIVVMPLHIQFRLSTRLTFQFFWLLSSCIRTYSFHLFDLIFYSSLFSCEASKFSFDIFFNVCNASEFGLMKRFHTIYRFDVRTITIFAVAKKKEGDVYTITSKPVTCASLSWTMRSNMTRVYNESNNCQIVYGNFVS